MNTGIQYWFWPLQTEISLGAQSLLMILCTLDEILSVFIMLRWGTLVLNCSTVCKCAFFADWWTSAYLHFSEYLFKLYTVKTLSRHLLAAFDNGTATSVRVFLTWLVFFLTKKIFLSLSTGIFWTKICHSSKPVYLTKWRVGATQSGRFPKSFRWIATRGWW